VSLNGPEVVARTELSIFWMADIGPNRRAFAREAALKYAFLRMSVVVTFGLKAHNRRHFSSDVQLEAHRCSALP
jgi:hypothetical protein